MNGKYVQQGLYRREYEHDACGVGMVANLSGEANHDIVGKGMTILKRLMHRGATGNDPETGDGAGLLMRIPHGFFKKVLKDIFHTETQRHRGIVEENADAFGVAMLFGGEGEEKKIEKIVKSEGCEVLGWRDVPTNPDAIGHDARSVMPKIRQLFISASHRGTYPPLEGGRDRWESDQAEQSECRETQMAREKKLCDSVAPCDKDFERQLYIIRREIEKATKDTYVCSCSSRTIVYKGLLLATQIEKFYPDLSDPDFISPFAIVHQR